MGYEDQMMSDQQVSVSSSSQNKNPDLRLSSPEAWRPQLDNPDQYVQFDFLAPRNLTGVETKGGNGIWTTAYKVQYSIDGKKWNPVLDDTGAEKEYLGNVDDMSSKVNYFIRPLRARLLKVFPTKWHQHIGLKVEIHGCFEPYRNLYTFKMISFVIIYSFYIPKILNTVTNFVMLM
jgi:von Willebrand factor